MAAEAAMTQPIPQSGQSEPSHPAVMQQDPDGFLMKETLQTRPCTCLLLLVQVLDDSVFFSTFTTFSDFSLNLTPKPFS
jgi:hypothetical protein